MTIKQQSGLNDKTLSIIARILKPYHEKIDRYGLFGSRATGQYRDNSDIDLVICGTIDQDDLNKLRLDFEESYIPYTVDIIHYETINEPALKNHIDQVFLPLH